MKQLSIIDKFCLLNPAIRGFIQWGSLLVIGILGLIFSWPRIQYFPITNILGGLLILSGFAFHVYAEKDHKQAHESSDKIKAIVETGIYAKIRHPLYLSLIIINIGIALAFGGLITLILSFVYSFGWGMIAIKEEKFLLQKFPTEYRAYMNHVKWRILPNIF